MTRIKVREQVFLNPFFADKKVVTEDNGIAYFELDDYISKNESKMFYFQVFDKVGNRYIPKSYKLPINVQKYYLYQATLIKKN